MPLHSTPMTPTPPEKQLARAAAAERLATEKLDQLMRSARDEGLSVPRIAAAAGLTQDQARYRLGEKGRPVRVSDGKQTYEAREKDKAERRAVARELAKVDALLNRQPTDLEAGLISVVEATRRLSENADVPVARSTVIAWIKAGRIETAEVQGRRFVVTDDLGRVVVLPKESVDPSNK